jgi:hypothetical protein
MPRTSPPRLQWSLLETANDTTIKVKEPASGARAAAPDAAMVEAAEKPAQDTSKTNPCNEADENALFEQRGQAQGHADLPDPW